MHLTHLLEDLRYAVRGLWRDRVFTATTVATLAVALALVTVVFAIFNAYVLRPYAVRDPFSLYEIRWQSRGSGGRTYLVDARYQELLERTRPVRRGGRRTPPRVTWTSAAGSRPSSPATTSRPSAARQAGRVLTAFDAAAPDAGPVAVLSFDAWTRSTIAIRRSSAVPCAQRPAVHRHRGHARGVRRRERHAAGLLGAGHDVSGR